MHIYHFSHRVTNEQFLKKRNVLNRGSYDKIIIIFEDLTGTLIVSLEGKIHSDDRVVDRFGVKLISLSRGIVSEVINENEREKRRKRKFDVPWRSSDRTLINVSSSFLRSGRY